MGRFRPRRRPGSKYITPEGGSALRAELDELWRIERPRVTQAVAEAAAQGIAPRMRNTSMASAGCAKSTARVRFLRQRLDGHGRRA